MSALTERSGTGRTLAEAQSDPPTAQLPRVAVDETRIEVDGETKWLYAAVDTGSKLSLEIDVFSRCGSGPAAFTRAGLSSSPSERSAF